MIVMPGRTGLPLSSSSWCSSVAFSLHPIRAFAQKHSAHASPFCIPRTIPWLHSALTLATPIDSSRRKCLRSVLGSMPDGPMQGAMSSCFIPAAVIGDVREGGDLAVSTRGLRAAWPALSEAITG